MDHVKPTFPPTSTTLLPRNVRFLSMEVVKGTRTGSVGTSNPVWRAAITIVSSHGNRTLHANHRNRVSVCMNNMFWGVAIEQSSRRQLE